MIAALYVRVSTQEQKNHGISVENQIDALKEYCSANGIDVFRIYNDAGVSAHVHYKKRQALQHLIEDSKRKAFDIILFTRLDRWFRSVKDYYAVMEQLGGIPWKAIWEDYETQTSSGQFKVNIMLSVAQAEAERDGERIRAIHEYRKDNGQFVGSAPTGYDLKKIDGKSVPVKNADAPMVECFFKHYLETFSVTEAYKKCVDAGYNLNFRLARRIAVNESYTGHRYNCTYEPFITDKQYKTILEQRSIRTRTPKNEANVYIFRGLLKCSECGGSMYGRLDRKGSMYYRCSHPQSINYKTYLYASEMSVEKALLRHIDGIIGGIVIKADITAENTDFEAQIKKYEDRLTRLKDLYEFGDITPKEYREKRDDLKLKIEKAKEPMKKLPVLPEKWQDIYDELDREHRRDFWRKIIDHIDVKRGTGDEKYTIHIRGYY